MSGLVHFTDVYLQFSCKRGALDYREISHIRKPLQSVSSNVKSSEKKRKINKSGSHSQPTNHVLHSILVSISVTRLYLHTTLFYKRSFQTGGKKFGRFSSYTFHTKAL